MNLAEAVFNALYSFDSGFGDNGAVRVSERIGTAVNFTHRGVIGCVVDKMHFVALGFQPCFNCFVEAGNMGSWNDEVISDDQKVYDAGQKSVAAAGVGCTRAFEQ